MTEIGQGIVVLGILIVFAGGVFMLVGRSNVHRGECGVVGGPVFRQPLSAINSSYG
ncbi:MAG: hypothetical protein QOD84_2856 [Acidobacteriaceae bacterium]|jgi:hypothetical protein